MEYKVAVDPETLNAIRYIPEITLDNHDTYIHFDGPRDIPQHSLRARRNADGQIELYQDMDVTKQVFAKAYDTLRTERNSRLSSCDWTQFPNTPLSDEKRAEWITYRQALRDLPATVTDPTSVTWPTPPS
jgi:hypothetical protein